MVMTPFQIGLCIVGTFLFTALIVVEMFRGGK
jgi:hypothetical protein